MASDVLTADERRIVDLMYEGLMDWQIGAKVGIGDSEVRTLINKAIVKTGVPGRAALVAWAKTHPHTCAADALLRELVEAEEALRQWSSERVQGTARVSLNELVARFRSAADRARAWVDTQKEVPDDN